MRVIFAQPEPDYLSPARRSPDDIQASGCACRPSEVAANVKWFPLVAPLRQAVRDNKHCLGINPHAGMTAQDFDVLNVVVVTALITVTSNQSS